MRILFTSVDGVLNSEAFFGRSHTHKVHNPSTLIDAAAVKLFSDLVITTNSEVVLASSWRYVYTKEKMTALLRANGYAGPDVIDTTPMLSCATREQEVQRWLSVNQKTRPLFSYAILCADTGTQSTRTVTTSRAHGLTAKECSIAASILTADTCCKTGPLLWQQYGTGYVASAPPFTLHVDKTMLNQYVGRVTFGEGPALLVCKPENSRDEAAMACYRDLRYLVAAWSAALG